MKRIILHIGQSKTGSTALQSFLRQNITALKEDCIGFYIPSFNPHHRAGNAEFVLRTICDERNIIFENNDDKSYLKDWDLLSRFIKEHDVTILSEELLWEKGIGDDLYWKCLREHILHAADGDASIDVILFLRRQDEWLYARWTESILGLNQPEVRDFSDFINYWNNNDGLDYEKTINLISKVFGRQSIHVIGHENPYKSKTTHQKDTVQKFFDAAGLPLYNHYVTYNKMVHPSITCEAAMAVVRINRGEVYYDGTRSDLRRAADLFSILYPEDMPIYPLSPWNRDRLLARYQDGNTSLANQYNYGKPLFSDIINPYHHEPPCDEDVKKAAETIVRLTTVTPATERLLKTTIGY